MPNYPVVNLLVSHGKWFAAIVAALPVVAGIYLVLAGAGWIYLCAGVVTGAVLYVISKSYVELVCIIADMLLPR
jgi:hypothetical protein